MGKFFGNISEYDRKFLTKLVARMNDCMGYEHIKYIKDDVIDDEHSHADAIVYKNKVICNPGFANIVFIVQHMLRATEVILHHLNNGRPFDTTDEDRLIVRMFIHLVNTTLAGSMREKRCTIWMKTERDKDCIYIQYKGRMIPRKIFTSYSHPDTKYLDAKYMSIDPQGDTKYPYPLIYGIAFIIDWLDRIGVYNASLCRKEYSEVNKAYIDYAVFGDKVNESTGRILTAPDVRSTLRDLAYRINDIIGRKLYDYVCDDENGDHIDIYRPNREDPEVIYIKWSDTLFFIYYFAYIPTFSESDGFQEYTPYEGVFDKNMLRRIVSLINKCISKSRVSLSIDNNWDYINLCSGAGSLPIVSLKDPSTYVTHEWYKGDLTEIGVIMELMKQLDNRNIYTISKGHDMLLKGARGNRVSEGIETSLRITPQSQMEEEYIKAYEDGDERKAMQLLKDMFARTFPENKIKDKLLFKGKNGDWTEDVAGYFTDDEEFSIYYGERGEHRNFFIRMENPFEYDFHGSGSDGDYPGEDGEIRDTYGICRNADAEAENQGKRPYDGYILRNVGEGAFPGHYDIDDYIVNDPRNVWPADPFMFDKENKLIPLSRRFLIRNVANESATGGTGRIIPNANVTAVIRYIINRANQMAGKRVIKYHAETPAGDFLQFSSNFAERGFFISLAPPLFIVDNVMLEMATYFYDLGDSTRPMCTAPYDKKFLETVGNWICSNTAPHSFTRVENREGRVYFCMYENRCEVYALDMSNKKVGTGAPYEYPITDFSVIWTWMQWLMKTQRMERLSKMKRKYKDNVEYYDEDIKTIYAYDNPWGEMTKKEWDDKLLEAAEVSAIKTRPDIRAFYQEVVKRFNEIIGIECMAYLKDTPGGDYVQIFLKNGEGPGDDLDTGIFVSCFHSLFPLGLISYKLGKYLWGLESRLAYARRMGHDMQFLKNTLRLINKCLPSGVETYLGYERDADLYYIGVRENGIVINRHFIDYIEKGKKISHTDIDLVYHTLNFLEDKKRTHPLNVLDGYSQGENFLKGLVNHGLIYSVDKPFGTISESIEDGMKRGKWNPMIPETLIDMVAKFNESLARPVMTCIYDPEHEIFSVQSDVPHADDPVFKTDSMYGCPFLECFLRIIMHFKLVRSKVGSKEPGPSYQMDMPLIRRILSSISLAMGTGYKLSYGTYNGDVSLIGQRPGFEPEQLIDFSMPQKDGYLDEGEMLVQAALYLVSNWSTLTGRKI